MELPQLEKPDQTKKPSRFEVAKPANEVKRKSIQELSKPPLSARKLNLRNYIDDSKQESRIQVTFAWQKSVGEFGSPAYKTFAFSPSTDADFDSFSAIFINLKEKMNIGSSPAVDQHEKVFPSMCQNSSIEGSPQNNQNTN